MIKSMEEIFHIEDDRLSALASVLSSETGRTILSALSSGPKSAGDISESSGLPISTVMFHLSKLVESGFVRVAGDIPGKHGRKKLYELTSNRFVITVAPKVEEAVLRRKKVERHRIFDYTKPVLVSLMVTIAISGIFLYSTAFLPKAELARAPRALITPSGENVTPEYQKETNFYWFYIIIFAIVVALTSSLVSTWISRRG
jgi:DNA-binding transcriptional ArsR family regulator